ncbi:hypothetical protein DSECCO2_275980 [anaerobic digester metagenome]
MNTSPVEIMSQAVSPLSTSPSAAATGEESRGSATRAKANRSANFEPIPRFIICILFVLLDRHIIGYFVALIDN